MTKFRQVAACRLWPLLLPVLLLSAPYARAQPAAPDPWKITADKIDPANYYGVTVANGMLGLVSSAEPFKLKSVVLAGAYDQYGRGRVSNFLNSFNLLNMYLEMDGRRLGAADVSQLPPGAGHAAGLAHHHLRLPGQGHHPLHRLRPAPTALYGAARRGH